ncbi:hypothetical protein [Pseudomonas botevensis]|uniref:hypothetical protein n=1 Tax=Pseudomonas botevensis TaxID=2842352 RepID=UPI001C3D343C|nr:hypothetical protein [Pseudomonas botevensis]MBV4474191.1 hypothetical protein [Pseudomonas botevensis]
MDIYKKYRLWVLWMCSIAGGVVGYFLIGPFIVSDAYQWIAELVNTNKLVADLIDINGMVRDKLLASTLPFFIVWSCMLTIYVWDKGSVDTINQVSKNLTFLTGGTAFFTIVLGFTLLGTFSSALQRVAFSGYTILLIVLSILLIIMGFVLRHVMKPTITPASFINQFAPCLLALCMAISLALYVYGILNDPIKLYGTILKHHALLKPI